MSETPELEDLKRLVEGATQPAPAPRPEQTSRAAEAMAATADDAARRAWAERTRRAQAELVQAAPGLIVRLEKAERALADVVNPLGKLIRDIEAGGGKPNELAHDIANSVTFIQSIARAALTPKGDPS